MASLSSLLGNCPTMVPQEAQITGFQQSSLNIETGSHTNSVLLHFGQVGFLFIEITSDPNIGEIFRGVEDLCKWK
jgi:hypothetical protein